jgi:hypothetical protein
MSSRNRIADPYTPVQSLCCVQHQQPRPLQCHPLPSKHLAQTTLQHMQQEQKAQVKQATGQTALFARMPHEIFPHTGHPWGKTREHE